MIRHNLLMIYRSFKRSKSSFYINLIGLSTGLASTILIMLWVNDELNVDKFHQYNDQLFQVMENMKVTYGFNTQPYTPDLLAQTMKEELPEVEYAAGVAPSTFFEFTLSVDEKKYKSSGQFAGEDFFKMFSFDLIDGNKSRSLTENNTIVITEGLAMKIFGTTKNIVGKSMEWQLLNFKKQAVVAGVCINPQNNSTMQFDFVLPFGAWIEICHFLNRGIHWGNHGLHSYIVLKKGTDVKSFNKKIAGYVTSKNKNANIDLFIRPFLSAYLYDEYENGKVIGGRIEYVKLFSIIAGFILLIACINFMNLSTAKASGKMKEVGIKKTIGAKRGSLVIQHLGESISMAFLSLLFALIIVAAFLPQFNEITGKNISMNFDSNVFLTILGITLLTGIVAGSYPALYISRFNPVLVLKGMQRNSSVEFWVRKGLVVFQFSLSIILIVSVLVVYKQIDFIQAKNLGYDKDNIIYFDKDANTGDNLDAFLNGVKSIPGVIAATGLSNNIVGNFSSTTDLNWEGKDPNDITVFANFTVNYDFANTLGLKFTEGRDFSRDFGSEDTKIIFNEEAINLMGLKNPVGKTVRLWGYDMQIIGVIKNFNFESLRENIKPMFAKLDPARNSKIMVRIKAGMQKETLAGLKTYYEEFNSGYTFEYKFLDKEYQALYDAEKRVEILSRYFAGIAIIISCLGLFGLTAYTAERKRKEIGIRKALGLSELGIIYLLSNSFTKMVLVSIIIALPVSYFIVRSWLNGFAFKIELELWYFIGSGLLALIIAWITVGIQAVKAAAANPIDALRYE
ncbi:MAG: ABC transporter permease [Melioribacteraceae bacterium]